MIFLIGTCDTKADELNYLRQLLVDSGHSVQVLDVSTQVHGQSADVPQSEILRHHPQGEEVLSLDDRGAAIGAMAEALKAYLQTRLGEISGIIGIGGSGGTSLITQALRALPVGLPKIMVSTVASGNTRHFVEASDIMMMYSVTDLAGLNSISRRILANAAFAMSGMVQGQLPSQAGEKPALGMSMFGVTTPCVQYIRRHFESRYDCIVFHATGLGGQSMEKLIASRIMPYVIDVTLTEVCDLLMGGILSAGEGRLDAIIETGIPYVGSVGALDMVNFGPMDTVPPHYQHRLLYRHNAQVTLMRTTPEENHRMGQWIAAKLNLMPGPVRFLLPEKGVSLIDVPGKPFYDPEADEALFESLQANMLQHADKQLIRLPYAINDPEFAEALIAAFEEVRGNGR